jgi:hypothetical protein
MKHAITIKAKAQIEVVVEQDLPNEFEPYTDPVDDYEVDEEREAETRAFEGLDAIIEGKAAPATRILDVRIVELGNATITDTVSAIDIGLRQAIFGNNETDEGC